MMAEVLECYSDLLVKTNRLVEGTAMKNRADAIWRAYGAPVLSKLHPGQPSSQLLH
jgi:hypothetical protein